MPPIETTLPLRVSPWTRLVRIVHLTRRRLLAFVRDKSDVLVTFGQAPLLALVFFFVFQEIVTHGETKLFQALREYPTANMLIFIAALTAVWFGASKSIVEIPDHLTLFRQERLTFNKPWDFVLSGFLALSLIALGQVLLFLLAFHALFIAIPAYLNPYATGLTTTSDGTVSLFEAMLPWLWLKLAGLLWLTAMAAIATAMLVSVFVKTRAAAIAVLTFLMIAQMLLGGSLIKRVTTMNEPVRLVSSLMAARWAFEGAVIHFEWELNAALPRYQIKQDSEGRKTTDQDFRGKHFTGTGTGSQQDDFLSLRFSSSKIEKLLDKPDKLQEIYAELGVQAAAEATAALASCVCRKGMVLKMDREKKSQLLTAEEEAVLQHCQSDSKTLPAEIPDSIQAKCKDQAKAPVSNELDKLFRALHEHEYDDMSAEQKRLLEILHQAEPLLYAYRPANLGTVYAMLFGLIAAFLAVTWLLFRHQERA